MNNNLLIIPVFNEEETIGRILQSLIDMPDLDVVVVDDSSSDRSRSIIEHYPHVQLVPLPLNLGAWGAIQTGFRFALKKGYESVITMDGDGQHHSDQLPKLINIAVDNPGVDVVIGTCTSRSSALRRWAWRYFRHLAGISIEDITSGFRLYKRDSIRLLSDRKGTLLDYQDVGILLLLQEAGLKVAEVEVEMSPRSSGKSHIYYNWFAVAYYMLSTSTLSLAKGRRIKIRQLRR